jgi:hypothetical protein
MPTRAKTKAQACTRVRKEKWIVTAFTEKIVVEGEEPTKDLGSSNPAPLIFGARKSINLLFSQRKNFKVTA